jgi:ATP-dependent helicase/nuclease subunit A
MRNITYISAGAGSGKTYRLTHDLSEFIQEGLVRPEQVIMATFTEKAAAELRERARSVLYESQQYEAAIQLDQSLIGTIHSIGYSFIERYWYSLGFNARQTVMPDTDVDFYISQSLSNIAQPDDISFFKDFRDTFDIQRQSDYGNGQMMDFDFWKTHLQYIIEKARTANVTSFERSKEISLDLVETVFEPNSELSLPDNQAAHNIVEEIYRACVNDGGDSQAAIRRINAYKEFLEREEWNIADLNRLYKNITSPNLLTNRIRANCPNLDAFTAELSQIWHQPLVTDKVKAYIERIFKLAEKWVEEYKEYKKSKAIIDYNDMEILFLELLKNDDVKKEISGRYKYIFVDEFQDCNPIQVKIFSQLSDLVEHSYWVGDSKQAIYGFRGTDTALTDSVAAKIEKSSPENFQTLDTNYRSLTNLVNVVNSFFSEVFVEHFEMFTDANRVKLKVCGDNQEKADKGQLQVWHVNLRNAASVYPALACQIAGMIHGGGISPKDIAVLARSNDTVNMMAKALMDEGIPVNQKGNGTSDPIKDSESQLKTQDEISLVEAILSYLIDNRDDLAKAQILYLTQEHHPIGSILDDRLQYLSEKKRYDDNISDDDEQYPQWLNDNAFIKSLEADRRQLSQLSVTSMVQSVIVRYDLYSLVSQWGDGAHRKANLDGVIALAREYEDHCVTMTLGASPLGFLNFLEGSKTRQEGDSEGVFVNTYHKSKGLEWNHVILLSLGKNPADDKSIVKKSFFGIQTVSLETNDNDGLSFSDKAITLLPFLFGAANSNAPDDMQTVITALPSYTNIKNNILREEARLMYVGMTRAKKDIVLVSKNRTNFSWLNSMTGRNIVVPTHELPEETPCDILATGDEALSFRVHQLEPIPNEERGNAAESATCSVVSLTKSSDKPDDKKRYLSPSTFDKTTTTAEKKFDFQSRINLKGTDDMATVGDCIHDIFCVLKPHDGDDNTKKAKRLIEGYGMQNHLTAEEILSAYDRFFDKMKELYGNPTRIYHELPFFYADAGSIVRGSMDFVYETQEGCVLVDFKTNPQGGRVLDETDKHYAGNYNTQFTCYATALQKAGKTILEKLVYYPVSGLIVQL